MRTGSFIDKLKVAAGFLFGCKVAIMQCERCGSIYVDKDTRFEAWEDPIDEFKELNVKRVYRVSYTCRSCGAQVVEKQFWLW